jgi:uncharacterized protein (DUF427 family)
MATRVATALPRELRYEPTEKRVRAELGGETVADSTRALLVWEAGRVVPGYALPEADVRREQLPAGAARECGDPDLRGYLALDWDAFDRWLEEEDEAVGHPRDPFHRIDVHHGSRHVVVELGGERVAETTRPVLLFETGLPTRYYLEHDDVRMDLLIPTQKQTTCAYKGHASHFTIAAGGERFEDIAWSYLEPLRDRADIRGLIAFYNERADLTVDGERLERPITQWS